jgi:hypothetical protein
MGEQHGRGRAVTPALFSPFSGIRSGSRPLTFPAPGNGLGRAWSRIEEHAGEGIRAIAIPAHLHRVPRRVVCTRRGMPQ